MAERHESMLRVCRKRLLRNGLKEAKNPMPTFRPDIFAERRSSSGEVNRELAVEAEIDSTLFSEHTSSQLVIMDTYIRHKQKSGIRVDGYLLVPPGKHAMAHAQALLDSLFPSGTRIRVLSFR
jgi:hypothetical protein